MKKTLTEQYRLIKKDKGHKGVFLKEAKRLYPNLIRNSATFKEASNILKQKNIINENVVGIEAINNPFEIRRKESYESAFENFLKEAEVKAEEKKVSKEVEEDQEHAYDAQNKKNPNNMIFGQIQMGVYFEAKQEKNADKTLEQIRDIVYKNLEKDPIYYTENGQFGEEIGYVDDAPALGEPKEATGKYKESGYGNLKEHSISVAGGIVTGDGFSSMNYMDYFGLNEISDDDIEKAKEYRDVVKDISDLEGEEEEIMEDDLENKAPWYVENVISAAEEAYDAGMDIKEILSIIEQHLGLKMGDY